MSARLVAIQEKKGMIGKVTGAGAVKKTIKEWVEERKIATAEKRRLKQQGVAKLSAGREASKQGQAVAPMETVGATSRGKQQHHLPLRKSSAEAKAELRRKQEEKRREKQEKQKAEEEEAAKISEAAGSKRRHTGSSKLEKGRKGAGAPGKPCGRGAPHGANK